ncbi:hypothetical protein OUZ56_003552 [Daphnia magna]|uniref:Uncharacterized protein n=1 Tax=Daphnia magna TaxID=35525 RepID=A0ABR0A919_9CRUS|nr:hypothetical protein OUZ56_003552 [Daphnia magna]
MPVTGKEAMEPAEVNRTERRNTQQDRPRDNTAGGIQKVKLSLSCETLINPNALKNVVSYGKGGKKVADMKAMINVLMEDLWDRTFMTQHSLSGHQVTTYPFKFADYVTDFWEKHYNIQVETQQIRSSISTKLSTENSEYKKRASAILARFVHQTYQLLVIRFNDYGLAVDVFLEAMQPKLDGQQLFLNLKSSTSAYPLENPRKKQRADCPEAEHRQAQLARRPLKLPLQVRIVQA